MGGAVGEKIGEGGFADVYVWAPGQVVKLFKAGVPERIPRYEAYLTRAVFAAGGPAQEVLDEVVVDGQRGFVLPRLDGPTLGQALQRGEVTPGEAGAILARLGLDVHGTSPPRRSLPIRAYMEASLRTPEARIPASVAVGVLALIDRLPADDRLSHGDLHPGNVILTSDGPRLIDWTGAKRGGAALDLACCRFLFTDLVPESLGDGATLRALDAAVLSEYARLSGLCPAALEAAVEAHLPVVRVFHLLGAQARPGAQARLLERLEADLRL